MRQKTAVEYLLEIWNSRDPWDKYIQDEQFKKAIQMEKEQIINACAEFHVQCIHNIKDFEQYYNETYKDETH